MTAVAVEAQPDLARMQRDRSARIHAAMADQGVEALILLGNSNVAYATGARWPLSDPGRANVERPVAVVTADDPQPHLFTTYPDPVIPDDHLHGPVFLEFDEGVAAFAAKLSDLIDLNVSIAVDELPGSMQRAHQVTFPKGPPSSADDVIGAAKLTKTPDELGFLRTALRITEEAIADVHAALAPGVRQTDLTARFLHRVFELGADANILDPIWQVMPPAKADGPWTTHGDIACPLLSTERELVEGDVLWVDTGISYAGFASDFGRTWVVGRSPTARQRDQFRLWREIIDEVLAVTRAGATGRPTSAPTWATHTTLAPC
jgi:Xaa-Pro aminopeptidase